MSRISALSGGLKTGMSMPSDPSRLYRRFFYKFDGVRIKIFDKAILTKLSAPFKPEYLAKINDKSIPLETLADLIGNEFATIALEAYQVKALANRDVVGYFSFYTGKNKDGKQVALIDFI